MCTGAQRRARLAGQLDSRTWLPLRRERGTRARAPPTLARVSVSRGLPVVPSERPTRLAETTACTTRAPPGERGSAGRAPEAAFVEWSRLSARGAGAFAGS